MRHSLKVYVYVSDTKVDMLYDQIPPKTRDSMAIEWKVDLKLIGMKLSMNTPAQTRYTKLEMVCAFIDAHEAIGTVDNPKRFFRGDMRMRWGAVGRESAMVFFGGVTDRTIVGLGGSLTHVIGGAGKADVELASTNYPSSTLPSIYNSLQQVTRKAGGLVLTAQDSRGYLSRSDSGSSRSEEDLRLIAYTTTHLQGPIQTLEFLAIRLQEGSFHMVGNQSAVLLGSPLYVASTE
jgi:hypothetical protein